MKRKIISIIAILIFLVGVGFFIYPYVMDSYAKYQNKKVMDCFKKDLARMKKTMKEEADLPDGAISEESSNLRRLYKDMQEYNQKIVQEGQEGLHDPFAYETPAFDLRDYGFENNVIGIINIEKMDVSMPLYLGASKENMKMGAVVLGQTSMPIGEKPANMVIAAHRGYRGIKMFRDIQNMENGDVIQIITPFSTLDYKVTEIKIILPDDIDEILIQEGKNLVTLMTCHPYTKNTHRYLVVAELIDDHSDFQMDSFENDNSRDDNNDESVSEENGDTQSVSTEKMITDGKQKNNREQDADTDVIESKRIIWLETYVPIIGGVIVVLMIILGILTTQNKK